MLNHLLAFSVNTGEDMDITHIRTGLAGAAATLVLSATVAMADATFKKYNELIIVTEMVNRLHKACDDHLTDADHNNYQTWRNDNHVSEIEAFLAASQRDDKGFARAYRQIIPRIDQKVAQLTPKNCRHFSQLMGKKAYQPAKAYKYKVRGIVKAVSKSSGGTKAPEPLIAADTLEDNLERIETVVMDSKMRMGFGGALFQETNPVILLDDGWATTSMKALVHPGGFDAHRKEKPSSWKKWRSSWGDYELLKGEDWSEIDFDTEYDPLPDDTRLHRTYERLTGAGTTAVGGGDSVVIINGFQFFDNGQFIKGKHVSATAENGLGSVVVGSTSPDERGTYEIEDYVLTLTYDNGHKEMRGIVFDPDDTEVIWLNGYSYIEQD